MVAFYSSVKQTTKVVNEKKVVSLHLILSKEDTEKNTCMA